MKSIEKWVVAVTFTFLVVAFANYFYSTTALKHLDSVFLFESAQSVLESGQPTSSTVATWPDALKTFNVPVADLCQAKLERTGQEYNILSNHAYVSIFLIALLVAIIGPELAFAILNAFSHLLLLVIPFVFLRLKGVGILPSLAFVLSVAVYPAWSFSSVGDYYLDRLYMPFALLSLFLIDHIVRVDGRIGVNRRLLLGLVFTVSVTAMFTERAAIMVMGAMVFYLLFFKKELKISGARNLLLALVAVIAIYLWIYFKFVFDGIQGGGGILDNALVILRNPMQRLGSSGVVPFALVSLLFIGIYVTWSGARYIILAIGAILPNLFISVGGAELNGWSTHYHTMYLPFLIFVASMGFLNFVHYVGSGRGRYFIPIAVGSYFIIVSGFLNPYEGKLEYSFHASTKNTVLGKVFSYYLDPKHSYERVAPETLKSLAKLIPEGVRVSSIEGVMPTLYRARHLSYYPIDMDSADYLVVSGTASDGKISSIAGATSYLGPAQTVELNQCLQQRMAVNGFELYETMPSIGVLVFKRAHVGYQS